VVSYLGCIVADYFPPLAKEWTCMAVAAETLLFILFMSPAYYADLFGLEKKPFFTDSTMLLSYTCVLTMVHLAVPVRFCIVVSLDFFAFFLALAFMVVWGSPESPFVAKANVCILACHIIIIAFGKRRIEGQGRCSWLKIRREEHLRRQTQPVRITKSYRYEGKRCPLFYKKNSAFLNKQFAPKAPQARSRAPQAPEASPQAPHALEAILHQ